MVRENRNANSPNLSNQIVVVVVIIIVIIIDFMTYIKHLMPKNVPPSDYISLGITGGRPSLGTSAGRSSLGTTVTGGRSALGTTTERSPVQLQEDLL